MPRSTAVSLVFISSGILIAGGAVLYLTATQASASFGWFAYQPLSALTGAGLILMTPLAAVGIGIGVVGLIGLSLIVGIMIGRGSHRR